MYYYLLYIGIAGKEFSLDDFRSLFEQSRIKNERLAITGKLLHCEGTFIQLLEGRQQSVQELFQTIENDDRLIAVKLITTGVANERYYKDWTMAFENISLQEINELENCNHTDVADYVRAASSVRLLKLLAKS